MHDDPDKARVESRQLPIFARDARAICLEIELPAREAQRLHVEGFLTFDPATAGVLDESREAELRFLGALTTAGCTRHVLRVLLRTLNRPYCYDARRIFYDWIECRWRLLPGEDDPEGAFFSLVERLNERRERDALLAIREWIDEALDLSHTKKSLFSHEGETAEDDKE